LNNTISICKLHPNTVGRGLAPAAITGGGFIRRFFVRAVLSVITSGVEESHKYSTHFLLEKKESDKEILFNESGKPLYSDIA